jgi:hypothetical protein
MRSLKESDQSTNSSKGSVNLDILQLRAFDPTPSPLESRCASPDNIPTLVEESNDEEQRKSTSIKKKIMKKLQSFSLPRSKSSDKRVEHPLVPAQESNDANVLHSKESGLKDSVSIVDQLKPFTNLLSRVSFVCAH